MATTQASLTIPVYPRAPPQNLRVGAVRVGHHQESYFCH